MKLSASVDGRDFTQAVAHHVCGTARRESSMILVSAQAPAVQPSREAAFGDRPESEDQQRYGCPPRSDSAAGAVGNA